AVADPRTWTVEAGVLATTAEARNDTNTRHDSPEQSCLSRLSHRACASRIGACRYWLHGSTRAAFGGRIARATRDGPKALRILRSARGQQGRQLREGRRPQRRSG